MANHTPRDPTELPDVLSAVLTPWDDAFLDEGPLKGDDDERTQQIGRLMYSQYVATTDCLILQAVENLGPRLNKPRSESSRSSSTDPLPTTDLPDTNYDSDWVKREQKRHRSRMKKTSSERLVLKSLEARPEETKDYEVNPIDQVVSAFTRYTEALIENDKAHFELFTKADLTKQRMDDVYLKSFVAPSAVQGARGTSRKYSVNRAQSFAKTRRPDLTERPALAGRRASGHTENQPGNSHNGTFAIASDDDVDMVMSPGDVPASRRGSLTRPTTAGSSTRVINGTGEKETRQDPPPAKKPPTGPREQTQGASHQAHLQSIFANSRNAQNRDRERDKGRNRDREGRY